MPGDGGFLCRNYPRHAECDSPWSRFQDSRVGKDQLDRISIELIAEGARHNDGLAFRVFDGAVAHMGRAPADVVNLLNPSMVILGGPLFRAAPSLLDPLKRGIKQRCANQVQLRVSQLGGEAGALGAATAIAEQVLVGVFISVMPVTRARISAIAASRFSQKRAACSNPLLPNSTIVSGTRLMFHTIGPSNLMS